MSQVDAPQSATKPAEPKRGSTIRLIVLLGILAVVLTAFLIDLFWMYGQVKAASERLQEAAEEMAERPREEGKPQFLSREDVVQKIGFQPTNSTVENGRLFEQYRWWGSLPLERRFITVEYEDEEGNRYTGYKISNRDIFGRDEEESMPEKPQPASTQPVPTPVPGEAQMPPSGITGPPAPGSSESGSESTGSDSEKEKAADDGEGKPTDDAGKSSEEAKDDQVDKDDSNTEK